MPNPAMAINMGPTVKAKRCPVRSDRTAITIEKAQAAAHGGMEYSWVMIAEKAD